ncbi:MAG: signal peptide peptidase SppA [Chloroflexota bacterium]
MSTERNVQLDAVLRVLCSEPWAILPERLTAIAEDVALRLSESFTARALSSQEGSEPEPQSGKVAVIPINGVMQKRPSPLMDLFGGTSTERVAAALRQFAGDSSVKSIVLDVDSPGGTVAGTPELASEVREARKVKPVVAVANGMAASAAYWVASSASEVVVAPSGSVGSIGVVAVHDDISGFLEELGVNRTLISAGKYKTEANPYEPLSEEARQHIQERVDEAYEWFVDGVASGRNVRKAAVKEDFGQGRTVPAEEAVNRGMADRVATLDETIGRLASESSAQSGVARRQRRGARNGIMNESENQDLQTQGNDLPEDEVERIRQQAREEARKELEQDLGASLEDVRTRLETTDSRLQATRQELHKERVGHLVQALQGRAEHERVSLGSGQAFAPSVVKYVQPIIESDVDEEQVVTVNTPDGEAQMSVTDLAIGILNAVASAGDAALISTEPHGKQDHSRPGSGPSVEETDAQIDEYLRTRNLDGSAAGSEV